MDFWIEKINGVEVTCSETICWGEWDEYPWWEKVCSFSLVVEEGGFKITLVFHEVSEKRMLSLIKQNKDIVPCFFTRFGCEEEVEINPLDVDSPTCQCCLKKYV